MPDQLHPMPGAGERGWDLTSLLRAFERSGQERLCLGGDFSFEIFPMRSLVAA